MRRVSLRVLSTDWEGLVMKRESYWDYMGRKIRESREVMLTDKERIEDLENRLEVIEHKFHNMQKHFKRQPWRPSPFDG